LYLEPILFLYRNRLVPVTSARVINPAESALHNTPMKRP
jgi:hypothetical protein